MSQDLLLDTETHDLKIEDFDLSVVNELDYTMQHIKIRLLFIFREWFLDTTYGVKYFDLVWIKNPDKKKVDNVIKTTIEETPNVVQLTEYSSVYDPAARSFTVSFTADTVWGEGTTELELL